MPTYSQEVLDTDFDSDDEIAIQYQARDDDAISEYGNNAIVIITVKD